MNEREVPKHGVWKAHLGIVLICIILTSLVTLPFFIIGEVQGSGCCGGAMPVTHDGPMHFNQMQSFWRGLSSGVIYPRWDDMTHSGYGAPSTSFYPPAVYYLSLPLSISLLVIGMWCLLYCIGFSWLCRGRRSIGMRANRCRGEPVSWRWSFT
jgi:hypothetical protein